MTEGQRKILCIEDDRETAALIAEELVDRGYAVTVAHDGREGLAAILKTMPDLVLSDISMPLMSGFELLERLIDLAPRCAKMPFVFLTALTDRDNELKGRQLGADDYVTKPIDFDVLDTIITARLAGVARTGLWPKLAELNDREVKKHDDDGEEPVRRLPPLVAEVKGVPPHAKPDEREKRDDARECEAGAPRGVQQVQEGKIFGIGDEQQDRMRQGERQRDERNLHVILLQRVDSERRGDCLEARDQRKLQDQDR